MISKNDIEYTDEHDRIKEIAKQCVHSELFVEKFMGIKCFTGLVKIHSIAYLDGIGWAMVHDTCSGSHSKTISVYVTPAERRKGFGTKLLEILLKNQTRPNCYFLFDRSTKAGKEFYDRYFEV